MSRRPLTLHVSALSDAEYTSYTKYFTELATPPTDGDWERIVFSVREVRGWIRGRFGANLDGSVIDQILKLFCPDLGPQDVLTGGQFFAVLRLLHHAQAGRNVEESLVFVQANPNPNESSNSLTARQTAVDASKPYSRPVFRQQLNYFTCPPTTNTSFSIDVEWP
ncbi:hypothetical protein M422DRAFT_247124 [Sphaerobolus stellatus SS14]|nr:hypothetical protein M422DRAFT_247124 [Sphaerobolus stellatus SS14]